MTAAIIAIVPTELRGSEGARYRGPRVPSGWDVTPETSLLWTVYPLGRVGRPDVWFHVIGLAYHAASENALAVLAGEPAVVKRLATMVPRVLTLREARALASDDAVRVLWPDDRPHRYGPGGEDLGPDPAAERYAVRRTVAGYDYGRAAEETNEVPA